MEKNIDVAEIKDKKLIVNNKIYEVSGFEFEKEISRGANGIVYLVYNTLLDQKFALKIWLRLKANRNRPKAEQGIEEAKKTIKAQEELFKWEDKIDSNPYFIKDKGELIKNTHKLVGRIFYAGKLDDFFYTIMEYIDGMTLKSFLEKQDSYDIPFGVKYHIAFQILEYNNLLLSKKYVHGDLHYENIMIEVSQDSHTYDIKIIDFGTSFYTTKEKSLKRNLRLVEETINHCITPFSLKSIRASSLPQGAKDYNLVIKWMFEQLNALRAAFYQLGAKYVGWPYYYELGTYQLNPPSNISLDSIKSEIKQYEEEKKIILNKKFLSISDNWSDFNGETAVRGD